MKKMILTLAVVFTVSAAMATPGGSQRKSSVEDLGKGLQKITWYYDNGTIAEEGFYLNGEKHGTWTSYTEKGKKAAVANWINNRKDGNCYVMHENGSVKYQIVYSSNKKVAATEYDENGNLIAGN